MAINTFTFAIDRSKMINEAEVYWNEKFPAAKADSNKMLQEAETYRREVLLKAEGETDRFMKLLKTAREQRKSTKQMMYIETIRIILDNLDHKHIVTVDHTGNKPPRIKLLCLSY